MNIRDMQITIDPETFHKWATEAGYVRLSDVLTMLQGRFKQEDQPKYGGWASDTLEPVPVTQPGMTQIFAPPELLADAFAELEQPDDPVEKP